MQQEKKKDSEIEEEEEETEVEEEEIEEPTVEEGYGELVRPKLCWSGRLNLVITSFVAVFNLTFVRISISMLLVCMTASEGEDLDKREFTWSSTTIGYIISAAFYGFLLGPFLGGLLSFRIGGKLTLLFSTFACSLLQFAISESVRITALFAALRAVNGFFAGFILPAIYDLFSKWIVPEERQLLVTAALVGIPAASILNFPISGAICDYCGWIWLFYVPGIWMMLFGIVCIFVVYTFPEESPLISRGESIFLQQRIPKTTTNKIPWTSILKSMPIYAYILIHFSINFVHLTVIFSLPVLLETIHHISLNENGLLSSIPFIFQFLMRILMTVFFEKLRRKLNVSKNLLRKSFVLMGATFTSVFLLLAVFFSTHYYWLIVCFVMACTSMELSLTGGYLLSLLDLCPIYVNVLTGVSNAIANSAGLISPVLNGFITAKGTIEEWRIVFYVNISLLMGGMLFYLAFGQNDIQYWALGAELMEKPISKQSLLS